MYIQTHNKFIHIYNNSQISFFLLSPPSPPSTSFIVSCLLAARDQQSESTLWLIVHGRRLCFCFTQIKNLYFILRSDELCFLSHCELKEKKINKIWWKSSELICLVKKVEKKTPTNKRNTIIRADFIVLKKIYIRYTGQSWPHHREINTKNVLNKNTTTTKNVFLIYKKKCFKNAIGQITKKHHQFFII